VQAGDACTSTTRRVARRATHRAAHHSNNFHL